MDINIKNLYNVNYRLKVELQLIYWSNNYFENLEKEAVIHHVSSIHLEGYISKMHTIVMFNFITQNAYSQIK